jgi:hypothetical protein
MKIQLADGLPYHPTLRHPYTGKRLQAVCLGKNGPVWPVVGASEDDEEKTTEDDDGEDGDSKETGEKDGKGTEKPDDKLTSEQKRIAELEEEVEKVKKHRSAADKNKSALEKELNELRNKDLPEVERLKKELEEARDASSKSEASFKGLALENAFLNATQRAKITWHDPGVAKAAASAELKALEVGADGTVEGVDKLVKDLAKSKPFLVDSKTTTDSEKDGKKNGASGSAVGSGGGNGKGEKEKPSKEDLYKRFPALRK